MPASLDSDLAFVIHLARQAGDLARQHQAGIERLTKRGAEAVTEADRASQRLIVAGLRTRFPDDGIIGEEDDTGAAITNQAPKKGGRVWVIDPIDGTNNYVAGFAAWAVCIGLLEDGVPTLGVVWDPSRQAAYAAAKGQGAWLVEQGVPRAIRAQATAPGPASIILLTSNLIVGGTLAPWVPRWFTTSEWKFRMLGSAALECVQIGAGTAHASITLNGKLWDVAAAAAVVLEAGGRIVNPAGQDVFPIDLTGYAGAKVPFIAAAPLAVAPVLAAMAG